MMRWASFLPTPCAMVMVLSSCVITASVSCSGETADKIASAAFGPTPVTRDQPLEAVQFLAREKAVDVEGILLDVAVGEEFCRLSQFGVGQRIICCMTRIAHAAAVHKTARLASSSVTSHLDNKTLLPVSFLRQKRGGTARMAQRDGDRVRRVVRLRDLLHLQMPPRHFHDLMLIRAAVADDGLLDLIGVYSKSGAPDLQIASRITPRPWLTPMPVVTLLPQNSSSTATASGLTVSISCVISS